MKNLFLNKSKVQLIEQGGLHTAMEIEAQPELWKKIRDKFFVERNSILKFIEPVLGEPGLEIVLTGAGSSAFIGQSVNHIFSSKFNVPAKAIPTTTLVTHFRQYIDLNKPVLFISFARSGNSPESNAVVSLAETFCSKCWHIAITCNADGELATTVQKLPNGLNIVLPPESEDAGLAMTGSFTGMMLAAIALANIKQKKFDPGLFDFDKVSELGANLISGQMTNLEELSALPFSRIIFLGSGPLLGIAEESHLKVQELSDGQIVGKFDSFLGFRHGPKAIINNETLVVCLFSDDDHVFQYEKDLALQIKQDNEALALLGVFPSKEKSLTLNLGHEIVISNANESTPFDLWLPVYVLPAQIIGFFKSLNLGLQPDKPSKSGTITRVVKGVTIYPAVSSA
ncbi:MAG: SIS domain-containing protein [Balneolaceae bacterium]|nr:MAG: SIS domain-containing protein [Balneolaceae bacterium]